MTVERGGQTKKYDCLCLRCLAAENATAGAVTLRVGPAAFHYSAGSSQAKPESKAQAKPFRGDAPLLRK